MQTREQDAAAPDDDRTIVVRLMIGLFLAGPTFALLGLALPHAADANDLGILAVAGGSYLAAAVIFLLRDELASWRYGIDAVATYGSLLTTASIYFSGSTTTTGAVFYMWIILGAAYFLERPRVAFQLLIAAVGYGAALLLKTHVPGMVQAWILSVSTLAVAAAVVVMTRERVAALVARLNAAAETDPLTELLNRRGFSRRLELELDRARRDGAEVSLVSGDLDNFKQVNDRFGHQVGDDVLIEVGAVLSRYARRAESVARVGGEEFAILVSGTGPDALVVTDRLRERLREALADRYPGLTISFGIATFPHDGDTAEQLLRRADEALYAAKALGRDRAVVHDRETVHALVARPS